MSLKPLHLKQTADAFDARPDMSLMAALKDLPDAEATWQLAPNIPTISDLLRHVAWAKSRYIHEAFAVPMPLTDPNVNADGDSPNVPWDFPCGSAYALFTHPTIAQAISLLHLAHRTLVDRLQSCTEEQLAQPLPTRHAKQSAANLFYILAMHDTYHAGTIRARRTAYAARTGCSPG